jgi:putative phosphoribosyl transferase
VRNLGLPNNPILVMGAVCADGALVLNYELIRWLNISDPTIDEVIATEAAESRRIDKIYRGNASRLELAGKVTILVDDGSVTASAMRTAVTILRLRCPARIAIAVPVSSATSVLELRAQVTDFVACTMPNEIGSVGQWYDDFPEISDESVHKFYERANRHFRIPKLKADGDTLA